MADTKISALTAVTTPATSDEYVINQSGTSKKIAFSQMLPYTGPQYLVAANDAHSSMKNIANYQCDGTDDDVQIQAAIDALDDNIGGRVVLSEGTFSIGTTIIVRASGVWIQGQGMAPEAAASLRGGTRLQADSGLTGGVMRVSNTGDTSTTPWVKISDLGIDGNSQVGTSLYGIRHRGYWGIIQRVKIQRMSGTGLSIAGYNSSLTAFGNVIGTIFINDCAGAGLSVEGFGGDNHFRELLINNNGSYGIYNLGASNHYSDCHIYSNGDWGFYCDTGGARTKLYLTKLEHNTGGIWIDAIQCTVLGCQMGDNSLTTGSIPNVKISGDQCLFNSNHVHKDTSGVTGDDVSNTLSADNSLIAVNYFEGFTTPLTNTGTGNQGSANFGVTDF